MPFRVIISNEAFEALQEIFAYIEKDSPQNAATTVGRLLDSIDSLDFMPSRYGVVGASRKRNTPVHRMVVQPFLVYYAVSDIAHTVTVLTIVHGARRQPKRFD